MHDRKLRSLMSKVQDESLSVLAESSGGCAFLHGDLLLLVSQHAVQDGLHNHPQVASLLPEYKEKGLKISLW